MILISPKLFSRKRTPRVCRGRALPFAPQPGRAGTATEHRAAAGTLCPGAAPVAPAPVSVDRPTVREPSHRGRGAPDQFISHMPSAAGQLAADRQLGDAPFFSAGSDGGWTMR